MKYLFKRDTLLVTISVFIVLGLFWAIPYNFHFLLPVKKALYDFDYNDLSYTRFHRDDAPPDTRIVIVNIGDEDKTDITAILEKINSCRPKVIGLDVLFDEPQDTTQDSLLTAVIQNIPNLVLAEYINDTNVISYGSKYSRHTGFANFYGEKGSVIRYFSPFKSSDNAHYKSFAASITEIADSKAYIALKVRKKYVELIHYRRRQSKYLVVSASDLLSDNISADLLHDKIVLVGFMSDSPYDTRDKFFTPMNKHWMGKSLPDNFGVIIHANIISMILDGDYVYTIPWWVNWLVAMIVGWLYIALFIRYFIDKPIRFQVLVNIIQVGSIAEFIFIGLVLYNRLQVKINMTETFGVLLLAPPVLYFWKGLAGWLHYRFGFKTIFDGSHDQPTR